MIIGYGAPHNFVHSPDSRRQRRSELTRRWRWPAQNCTMDVRFPCSHRRLRRNLCMPCSTIASAKRASPKSPALIKALEALVPRQLGELARRAAEKTPSLRHAIDPAVLCQRCHRGGDSRPARAD